MSENNVYEAYSPKKLGFLSKLNTTQWHQLRIIPALDTNPQFIGYATTTTGRILLFLAFFLCVNAISLSPLPVPLLTLVCAMYAFAGQYRLKLFPLLTLATLILNPFWFSTQPLVDIMHQERIHNISLLQTIYAGLFSFFVFATLFIYFTYRFKNAIPFNKPIISIIIIFFTLVGIASAHCLHGLGQLFLWSFIITFSAYFWFLGYALLDRNSKDRSSLWTQLGTFHPFWGSSSTPYGKGAANLRRLEKNTPSDLAISQIKGVKLALWCFLVKVALGCLSFLMHDYLNIPTFKEAFIKQVQGMPYPRIQCWESTILAFFEAVLYYTVWCNVFIAYARMAGFQLLRGTYKPLYAKTIAEFWNRYIFYFKELLVEFFFYPAFLGYFKKHKKLRTAFATFMAVSIGNILYHFIRDIGYVSSMGLSEAIVGFQTYIFYTLVLAAGIIWSQLMPRTNVSKNNFIYETCLPFLRIVLFFSFLHIFDDLDRQYSLRQHFDFLFYILGLS